MYVNVRASMAFERETFDTSKFLVETFRSWIGKILERFETFDWFNVTFTNETEREWERDTCNRSRSIYRMVSSIALSLSSVINLLYRSLCSLVRPLSRWKLRYSLLSIARGKAFSPGESSSCVDAYVLSKEADKTKIRTNSEQTFFENLYLLR